MAKRESTLHLVSELEDLAEEFDALTLPDPDDPDEVLDALQRWMGKILAILVVLVKLMSLVGIQIAQER